MTVALRAHHLLCVLTCFTSGTSPADPETRNVRFLDADTIADLLNFPKDAMPKKPVEVSTLDRPRVHDYYMAGWQYWH